MVVKVVEISVDIFISHSYEKLLQYDIEAIPVEIERLVIGAEKVKRR